MAFILVFHFHLGGGSAYDQAGQRCQYLILLNSHIMRINGILIHYLKKDTVIRKIRDYRELLC